MTTDEKILAAAMDLMAEHGYKETTTKAIAAKAGVSEMTLFRHFGDKLAILKAIVQQPLLEYPLEQSLWQQMTWDLEKDLLALSKLQMEINRINEKSLLIKFREKQRLSDMNINARESSRSFHKFLAAYFDKMIALGKIAKTDTKKLADFFMSYNFGLYCDSLLLNGTSGRMKDAEIKYDAKCFAKGLRP